jgi:ABC-type Fe3+-hydroxamate transport system substrate-binding protein
LLGNTLTALNKEKTVFFGFLAEPGIVAADSIFLFFEEAGGDKIPEKRNKYKSGNKTVSNGWVRSTHL